MKLIGISLFIFLLLYLITSYKTHRKSLKEEESQVVYLNLPYGVMDQIDDSNNLSENIDIFEENVNKDLYVSPIKNILNN